MSTWDELREMRAQGMRPLHPLFVTTHPRLVYNFTALTGAMFVVQKAGQKCPFELLRGLEVWFRMDTCEQTCKIIQRCKELDTVPSRVMVYCACEKQWESNVCYPNCRIGDEIREAWSQVK